MKLKPIVLATLAMIMAVLAFAPLAHASIWTSYRHGYFDGTYYDSRFNWPNLQWSNRAYVVPEGISAYSVSALMNMIKCNYNNDVTNANCPFFDWGNGRTDEYGNARKTAAAFIVHSMLGHTQGTVSRNVSAAEFADVERRLNAIAAYGGIHWDDWHDTTYDGGMSEHEDVYMYDGAYQEGPAVVMYDRSGNPIYALFRECANPDGNLASPLPPADFNLTPSITGSPQTSVGGEDAKLIPSVTNSGSATSTPAAWVVSRYVVLPGRTYTTGTDPTLDPGTYLPGSTPPIASGSTSFGKGTTTAPVGLPLVNDPLADYDIGSKVCYVMSVQPATESSAIWRHSPPFCIVIAKSPKLQVHGGDIRVGSRYTDQTATVSSNITTSQNKKTIGTEHIFGSWGEYGILATGIIKGIGSGSAFAGPGLPNVNACSYTFLTFANATTGASDCKTSQPADFGKYSTGRTIPDISVSYPVSAAVGTLSGTVNLSTLNGLYKTSGDIVISGGSIAKGKSVIINTYYETNAQTHAHAYANVTIAGNIQYSTAALANGGEIPQVIIIAGDINVQSAVTQVDAWLSAEGTLKTCSDVDRADITIAQCNNPLTFNGPVMAKEVQLWRTGGSEKGAASGDPAEIFNLRPDAYLWGIAQGSKSGRLESVYERELPPRY
jgi:hypothetical protein